MIGIITIRNQLMFLPWQDLGSVTRLTFLAHTAMLSVFKVLVNSWVAVCNEKTFLVLVVTMLLPEKHQCWLQQLFCSYQFHISEIQVSTFSISTYFFMTNRPMNQGNLKNKTWPSKDPSSLSNSINNGVESILFIWTLFIYLRKGESGLN